MNARIHTKHSLMFQQILTSIKILIMILSQVFNADDNKKMFPQNEQLKSFLVIL